MEGAKELWTVNEAARQAKKIEMMEKCFACYAENGLNGVGVKRALPMPAAAIRPACINILKIWT